MSEQVTNTCQQFLTMPGSIVRNVLRLPDSPVRAKDVERDGNCYGSYTGVDGGGRGGGGRGGGARRGETGE